MSSCRIIKASKDLPQSEFKPFSFNTLNRSHSPVVEENSSISFTPLSIFDTSEINGIKKHEEPEPLPEGSFITDEELERRLRESFEQGLLDGKNLAERGLFNVFKGLRTATEQILDLREKVVRESEDELLKIVMAVAKKVIIKEVQQDRTIVSEVLKNSLSSLSENDSITVRLNPDDHAMASAGAESILDGDLKSLNIKPDTAIAQGFCQIETEMGIVDANLESQLDEIYRKMLEEKSSRAEIDAV